ncbi:MAG: hypothetical protein KBS76_02425 [Ruminococcus sp.]|nr:hypothetical protein [Candidatus Apopatosoma intestinale]
MANYKTTAELRDAVAALQSEAAAKMAALGRLCAKERMSRLFDEGTFVEVGTYIGRKTTELDVDADDALEPVVTGYGAIDGVLVFAFSQDYSRLSGALGERHAEKICKIYDMAEKASAPVIGVFDSAGAKILEGVDALAGYGKIMATVAAASVPQIAVVSGPCVGAPAVIAQMMDFTIVAKKTGELRIAASGALTDKTLGTPEKLAEDGVCTILAEDDADALEKAKTILRYFSSVLPSGDEPNRSVSVADLIAGDGYDMHTVISEVFDRGSFLELWKESAQMIVCGFATMNAKVVAVMANNPAVKGGKLCPGSTDKATKFVRVCEKLGTPIVTLVDSCGMPSGDKAEAKGFASKLAAFVRTYATCGCRKVSVVLGRAYGSLYTVFGPKALGTDVMLALDSAKIAAMAPDAAVAFLGEVKDESKHAEIAEEWARKAASPLQAAKSGQIDDIIASEELRQRIGASIEMLSL